VLPEADLEERILRAKNREVSRALARYTRPLATEQVHAPVRDSDHQWTALVLLRGGGGFSDHKRSAGWEDSVSASPLRS
jgi:hypothetical protein